MSGQSQTGRSEPKGANVSQTDIELPDGSSISLDRGDGDEVLLVVCAQNAPAQVISLSPAVAAYLAGRLAQRAGVIFR